MDTRERGTMDYGLIGIVSVMILFGLIMLLSASSPNAYKQFGDSYYFLKHQVIFGLIPGMAGLLFFSRIPYTFWKKHAWNLLLVSIGLLLLVFIPGFSAGFGTSHSWISIGGFFSIQPSEIVKLTFLFYLAGWLGARDERGVRDINTGLVPFLAVLGIIAILMILQPDTGSMTIIAAMSLVVYFVAGAPVKYVAGLIAAGLAGIWFLITITPYRAARFTTFLHPELDPQGIGYHINQALLALGSGGFFGLGYGHSRQKFQYLPEVAGDSVFAVIGEEMGFVISLFVIGLFLVLFWRLMEIAKRAPDKFSKYVCVGVAAWIVIQAFENIASMAALMPITGVPLPFISYGGTSLAILMCAIGVVLNISKHTK
ncbi:cell division protein FtsW [Candidatus Uhrbacteria bacterium RIFCSPHIGHO2_02_FULL_47_44]|uniref:Probable peptidoglycan glycosyltransferase FtsW n=1 Tax=Candidatus Uhrbacteria bacterium RIFCSPLOWO2_02_FULL_48_18 TaxID=1802408 RepID=A0A1F7V954_9BACT|nr:MAG: cell division protein FtsW [Candidatus Uhrbacteria bacterium RIFCSPHIGHO2_01_FULL_47_10]OGL71715.1 MAG: cell division protein FtsW [Candidatus Uhrbacteria bacterium RIFCSPHIGHO2_02_FULL_47_44]OGL76193.1 MAG: cell division protein FtsW [Candidatus Uhrbacteria bacterium RIFCSPHIGHO2_12_FULL_47_12]OGL81886.1 MAG: cell division protein FtsW [Candidatus Uhrbacteria bacterium RIFCSPLOWO2_01_FULL_47_17]OGL87049.1 MAG: cell division protein FtsW [Candidatus Uhrbacteria bacterium RIFCSPLOWO2_02_